MQTRFRVKLAQVDDENLMTRSQAKRMVSHFEDCDDILLDFADIETMGPSFADEIFRVFISKHPQVHLVWTNANPQVEKMIRRAKANSDQA